MKTTIDLPDDLFRSVKIRAARDHRTVRDIMAEALRMYLTGSPPPAAAPAEPVIATDAATGFPLVRTVRQPKPMSVPGSYALLRAIDEEDGLDLP